MVILQILQPKGIILHLKYICKIQFFWEDDYQTSWSQSIPENNNGFDNFLGSNGEYGIMIECGCSTCNYTLKYGPNDNSTYWSFGDMCPKLPQCFISRYKNKGGVAWIGHTNIGTGSDMKNFRDYYYNSIFSNDFNDITRKNGVGFAVGKNSNLGDYTARLGLTLFGDPEMNVWKNIPKKVTIEAINNNSVKFIPEDDSDLSDALVRLKTSSGWIETHPDEKNIVTSLEDFSEIVLLKDGYLPITAKVIENSVTFDTNEIIWQNLIVKGSINIEPNSLIKIVPGVSITLVENGNINAIGTDIHMSRLGCSVDGQKWGGLKIIGNNTRSKTIKNLIISDTKTAIDVQFPRLNLKNIQIGESTNGINAINSDINMEESFISTDLHGIKFVGCTGSLNKSIITECRYGITAILSSLKLRENYITNNSCYGVFIDGRGSYLDLGGKSGNDIPPETSTGNKIYNNGNTLENIMGKSQILIGNLGQINLYKGQNDIHSLFSNAYPEIPNICLLESETNPIERKVIKAWYNYWGKPTGITSSFPTSNYFKPIDTANWLDFSHFSTEEYFVHSSMIMDEEDLVLKNYYKQISRLKKKNIVLLIIV